MAGSSSDFDPAEFRSNIKAAMELGLPNGTSARPTFVFNDTNPTYPPGTKLDETGRPYDLTIKPTSSAAQNVQVDCAVEYGKGSEYKLESVGDFDPAQATLTILDTDYALIKDADYCILGGDRYEIRHTINLALFDVDVYQLFLYAIDET